MAQKSAINMYFFEDSSFILKIYANLLYIRSMILIV